jgi:hypothetical protein
LLMKQKKLGKRNDIQKINGIDLGWNIFANQAKKN